MKMKRLGHTDMQVSELCIGSMTFGEQNTQADCDTQLDMAIDHGINFIDTAEMYAVPIDPKTYGKTEEMIGNWLQARGNRNSLILATKAAGKSDRMDWVRGGNAKFDAENIDAALNASLKRLQTDYVDLYQLHWPDRNTNVFGQLGYQHSDEESNASQDMEAALRALKTQVDAGKVRAIGLSNETPWGVMEFLRLADKYDLPRVVSIQNPYNLINRTYEVGLSEVSIRENVGLMCYGILASGALSGKYLNNQKPEGARISLWPQYFDRYVSKGSVQATEQYVKLAEAHNITPSQLALAWGLSRPFMLSVILGATKPEQLKEQLQAVELTLSEDLEQEIENIHDALPNPYLIR